MRYQSSLIKSPRIHHGFFDCTGGVSTGHYTSLNCGYGSNDDKENVRENCHRVLQKLESAEAPQSTLITAYQIHSPKVVVVDKAWDPTSRPQVDGMVTHMPDIALGILTADCCPILFADEKNGIIGAAHAGWRGAISGILQGTISAMCQLGSTAQSITAIIGPTIQQTSYEVDEGFRTKFIEANPANDKFFIPSPNANHFQFDLPGYVLGTLTVAGIQKIDNCAVDTYPTQNNFFSYRRRTHEEASNKRSDFKQEPNYGRQISVISIRN